MFEGLRGRAAAWLRARLPEPWVPPPRTLAVDPADPDRIGFGPGIHRQPLSPPSAADAPWARDVGWGGCVAFLDHAGERLRRAPAAGETVPVRLSFPFQGRPGAPFWALFARPGMRDETGSERDGPGDLAALRLLRCRLLGPVRGEDPPGEDPFALGEAEILEALRPEDLLDGPASDGALGDATAPMGDVVVQVQGPLRLVRATYYKELYDELVLWQDGDRLHLLVRAHWSVDADAFAFGNRPLAPGEAAALARRIGEVEPDGHVAPSRNGRRGDVPTPSCDRHPWAVGAAFETSVAFLDRQGDLRAKAPRVGEILRVALDYPFLGRLGAPFWALYEHPHGYRNGYLDDAKEARLLAAMRFVRCRLVPWAALPAAGSYETLELEAEILEVLGPNDLLALPPSDGDVEEAIRAVSYRPDTNTDGRLTIVSSNVEGDVVNWLLLARVDGRVHLLARGEQVFHDAAVMFGNRPLTEAEAARLA